MRARLSSLDQRLQRRRYRQFVLQQGGRNQGTHGADAHVVDAGGVLRRVGLAGFAIVQRVIDTGQSNFSEIGRAHV